MWKELLTQILRNIPWEILYLSVKYQGRASINQVYVDEERRAFTKELVLNLVWFSKAEAWGRRGKTGEKCWS